MILGASNGQNLGAMGTFIVCCIVFRSNASGSYGHADSLLHSFWIKQIRELWEESGSYGKNSGAMNHRINGHVDCLLIIR